MMLVRKGRALLLVVVVVRMMKLLHRRRSRRRRRRRRSESRGRRCRQFATGRRSRLGVRRSSISVPVLLLLRVVRGSAPQVGVVSVAVVVVDAAQSSRSSTCRL